MEDFKHSYITKFYNPFTAAIQARMRTIILISLVLALGLATVVPRVTPVHSHIPLTYKVSLDDSPEVRWAPLAQDYAVPLARFMEYFDMLPIPATFFKDVEWFAKNKYQQK